MKLRVYFLLGVWFLFISSNLLIENVNCDVGEPLFLTPYIEIGDFETAKIVSEVNSTYFLDVKSYAGFITVDKEFNSNTWFWYFPVEGEKKDAPLIIWLQGGPGLSSLYSLFQGVGPFRYENDILMRNPDSWHMEHSVLFIDNPIGAGFSYTGSEEGYCTNQTQISVYLHKFLQQFYQVFPELQPVPMFLAGQSYAGKHIPFFAYEIHNRNQIEKNKINLKGMAIGNGWVDPPNLYQISSLAYHLGLIDIRQEAEVKVLENAVRLAIEQDNWRLALQVRQVIVGYISDAANLPTIFNYASDESCFKEPPYDDFMTSDLIREAVHVGNTSYQWLSMDANIHLLGENMKSAKPVLEILLEHYPIMMYNGQLDLAVAYPNLEKIYHSFNWTGAEDYRMAKRRPHTYEGVVVGYAKVGGNLYDVMFRNAGHCVAWEKPELLRMTITEFIRLNSQPTTSNVTDNSVIDDNENTIDSNTL